MWNAISWGFIGLLGGALAALAIALAAIPVFDISQREGAYAMGVAFFWVPLGVILGLVAGVVWGIVTPR